MKAATVDSASTTRDKLLDVAGLLFISRGYEGVSVRHITEAAGANVAAVNYHFGGKQNLYREVLRSRLMAGRERKISAIKRALDSGAGLDGVIRAYISVFIDDMLSTTGGERYLDIIMAELNAGGPVADVIMDEAIIPVHTALMGAIKSLRPKMADGRITMCIFSITGQIFHVIRARNVVQHITGRRFSRKFIDEFVEHVTQFSLKGIGE